MANKYWVGGGATNLSSDANNWSTTSGGAGGAGFSNYDTAIFDSGSSVPCRWNADSNGYLSGLRIYDYDGTFQFYTVSTSSRTVYFYDGIVIEGGPNFQWLDHDSAGAYIQTIFAYSSSYSSSLDMPMDLNGNTMVTDYVYLNAGGGRFLLFESSAYFVTSSFRTGSYYHFYQGSGGIKVLENSNITIGVENMYVGTTSTTSTLWMYYGTDTGVGTATLTWDFNKPAKNTTNSVSTGGFRIYKTGSPDLYINCKCTMSDDTTPTYMGFNGYYSFNNIELNTGLWRYSGYGVNSFTFKNGAKLYLQQTFDSFASTNFNPSVTENVIDCSNKTDGVDLVTKAGFSSSWNFYARRDLRVIYPSNGAAGCNFHVYGGVVSNYTFTFENTVDGRDAYLDIRNNNVVFTGGSQYRITYYYQTGGSITSDADLYSQYFYLSTSSIDANLPAGKAIYWEFYTPDSNNYLYVYGLKTYIDGVYQPQSVLFKTGAGYQVPANEQLYVYVYSQGTTYDRLHPDGATPVDWDFSNLINSTETNSTVYVNNTVRNLKIASSYGDYPQFTTGTWVAGVYDLSYCSTGNVQDVYAGVYDATYQFGAEVIAPLNEAMALNSFRYIYLGNSTSTTNDPIIKLTGMIGGERVYNRRVKLADDSSPIMARDYFYAYGAFDLNGADVYVGTPTYPKTTTTDFLQTSISPVGQPWDTRVSGKESTLYIYMDVATTASISVDPDWQTTNDETYLMNLHFESVNATKHDVYSNLSRYYRDVTIVNSYANGYFSCTQDFDCKDGWSPNFLGTLATIKCTTIRGWNMLPVGMTGAITLNLYSNLNFAYLDKDWEFTNVTSNRMSWRSDTNDVQRKLYTNSWTYQVTADNNVSINGLHSRDVEIHFMGTGVVFEETLQTAPPPFTSRAWLRNWESFRFVGKAGQTFYFDPYITGYSVATNNTFVTFVVDENSPAGTITFLRKAYWDTVIDERRSDLCFNGLVIPSTVNAVTLDFSGITQINSNRSIQVLGSIDIQDTGNGANVTLSGLDAICWSSYDTWTDYNGDYYDGQYLINADGNVFANRPELWVNCKSTYTYLQSATNFGIPLADKNVVKEYAAFSKLKIGGNNFCFFGTTSSADTSWATDKTWRLSQLEIDADVGASNPGVKASNYTIDLRKVSVILDGAAATDDVVFKTSTTNQSETYKLPDLVTVSDAFLMRGDATYNSRDDVISDTVDLKILYSAGASYSGEVKDFPARIYIDSDNAGAVVSFSHTSAQQRANQRLKKFWNAAPGQCYGDSTDRSLVSGGGASVQFKNCAVRYMEGAIDGNVSYAWLYEGNTKRSALAPNTNKNIVFNEPATTATIGD